MLLTIETTDSVAVEVTEHLDPDRLAAFERVVFELARSQWVVITTPNRVAAEHGY